MNDFNFFAPLQMSSHEHRSHGPIMPIVLVVVLAVIVAAPILAFGYELILNSRIAQVQEILSAPENKAVLDKLDAMQTRIDVINQSLPEIQRKGTLLDTTEWVTEQTMQVIIDTIPKQISANILAMANGAVQIDGIAVDRPAIAEMEYNLRKCGIADVIQVSHITKTEDGSFSYTINFTVKDVKPQ